MTIKGQKHRAVIKKREGTTRGERESETETQSVKIKRDKTRWHYRQELIF